MGHWAGQSTAVAGSGSSPTAVAVGLGRSRVAVGRRRTVVEAVVEEERSLVRAGRSTGLTCWLTPVRAAHSGWNCVYWLMYVAHLRVEVRVASGVL